MRKSLSTIAFTGLLGMSNLAYSAAETKVSAAVSKDLSVYEVPAAMKEAHKKAFTVDSLEYEDSLKNLQLVLLVDHSGSQQAEDEYPKELGPVAPKGMFPTWTQWDNTFIIGKYLAETMFQYDKDGNIPMIFFGNEVEVVEAKGIGEMLSAFKKHKPTNQVTNMLAALETAFSKYVPTKESGEGVLFIVLTDGAPTRGENQEAKIKKLISDKFSTLDPKGDRMNVLFVRIGDDSGAKAFLKDLDDCKECGQYVDTKSDNMIYKMGPKNMILNAIHEHLDDKYTED